MQRLNTACAQPEMPAANAWRPLPLLLPARTVFEVHRPWILRLAHALGATPAWFRTHAGPRMLLWESLVAGLPALPCERASSLAPLTAFAQVLASAARVAESESAPPMHRLRAAHRAALTRAWRCASDLVVRDADGHFWQAQHVDCRNWRARARLPQSCRPRLLATAAMSPSATPVPPTVAGLESALLVLHRRGIWRDEGRCGRWLACAQGWALLWPLAGRDLQGALSAGLSLSGVLQALVQAGYTPAGRGVMTASRGDGRTVLVLPATARLRQVCALPAAVPARPAVYLTGIAQDSTPDALACP